MRLMYNRRVLRTHFFRDHSPLERVAYSRFVGGKISSENLCVSVSRYYAIEHEQATRLPCAYKEPNNRNTRWPHGNCGISYRGRLTDVQLRCCWMPACTLQSTQPTRLIRTHGEASWEVVTGLSLTMRKISIYSSPIRFQKKKKENKGANGRGRTTTLGEQRREWRREL